MRRYRAHYPGIFLFAITTAFTQAAFAEIYRWVDAQGNIHFGDKPHDPAQADQAERVNIVESYQPPSRTDEEQNAYDREQQAIRRRSELYQQEDQEKRKIEQDKRNEEKSALCEALQKDINKLTTVELVDGVRVYHYLTGEDGESVSSDRQREIIKELETQYAAAGCN